MLFVPHLTAMPTRKLWLSIATRIVVCAVLLIAASLVFAWMRATAPQPAPSGGEEPRIRVLVMTAQPTPVRRQWHGFGTAAPVHSADVPSRISAVALERPDHIRPGRAVNKGDLLLRLDDSDFQRQVEIASQSIEDLQAQLNRIDVERKAWNERAAVIEEELALARAEFERARTAMANDAAKQREVDLKRQTMLEIERTAIAAREELDKVPLRRASLEAQKSREESSLALARQNLERCRIVAPIGGVLSEVDVDAGESVAVNQRIARIISLERIEVPLLLASSARPYISIGDEVALASDAGNPPLRWKAQVSRIAPDDDAGTRTLRVFAEVLQDSAKPGLLSPGTFVQGVVTAGDQESRSVVPRRAINSQRIMLVENGRVRSVNVSVDFHLQQRLASSGLGDTQWAVLRDPLPSSALVVVDGARAIPEGAPVEPIVARESVAVDGSRDSATAVGGSTLGGSS